MYEWGTVIAFFLWCYWVIVIVINAHSRLAKNLAKVDLRISWFSQQPVPKEDRAGFGWALGKCIFMLFSLVISMLLSWVSVAFSVGMIFYNKSKSAGMPAAIREARWKLRNIDLTRDQVIALFADAEAAIAPVQSLPGEK